MDNDELIQDAEIGPINGSADELNGSTTKIAHARLSRKRTKTGCLTCRRRRIKCGEERPTCGNCIKSKRQCEGYNQRVIFKDPMSTYRGPGSSITSFRIEPVIQCNQFQHQVPSPSQATLTPIAPKLEQSFQDQHPKDVALISSPQEYPERNSDRSIYDIFPGTDRGSGMTINYIPKVVSPTDTQTQYDTIETSYVSTNPESSGQNITGQQAPHYDFNSLLKEDGEQGAPRNYSPLHSGSDAFTGPSCASELSFQELVYQSDIREAASTLLQQSYRGSANWPLYMVQNNSVHSQYIPYHQLHAASDAPASQASDIPPVSVKAVWPEPNQEQKGPNELSYSSFGAIKAIRNEALQERAPLTTIEEGKWKNSILEQGPLAVGVLPGDHYYMKHIPPDDELFDVSDDEMNVEEYDHDPEANFGRAQQDHLKNNDLGIVVALQAYQDEQDQRLRTYHSFLDGYDMLTTYQPSIRSSPLSDSTTARIFCHYINVTGPSISLYERHPANPSLMFSGRPVPKSQQHIWAYTMPTLALNNQALLHAMLAIGSLHMALLQESPITASLKHYHIALRKVAKSVQLPTRRGQPATLAATMMLGWYELMSADHQKWSNHLLGAKQLLKEIDFAGMTRYLKTKRLQQRQAPHRDLYHHNIAFGISEGRYAEQEGIMETLHDDDVNETLIGMLMGRKLSYDQYGQVQDDVSVAGNKQKTYTQRELEIYENQRDLFWWYCKQDAFQSILSGNRLFMPYDLWSHCPPRASIGRRNATYGTYDHLILILGRLAEFAAKDLKRKRKAMLSNGGWRPPSGASSQSGSAGSNPSPTSRGPQMPSFAGMMPNTEGKATLPRGFTPTREESPPSDNGEYNLEDWTKEAEEEWQEIRAAFSIFDENLGPDFQALGPEHSQPIQSPFGPALQYRTYGIAGIWIMFYMGLILCHRYHPSMPPAATLAAGIAARQTASYANEIGRIAAAIAPEATAMSQVSTQVGAGLIEATFGLFIAGVQYQDPAQRHWLVQRCSDVKRLTGWQTSNSIAMGCELVWVKAAEAGRGPPYSRLLEKKHDQSVWDTARRRIDHVISERSDPIKMIVAKTDRVHYALGLLGVEEDFENLEFDTDNRPGGS